MIMSAHVMNRDLIDSLFKIVFMVWVLNVIQQI
jgi:hypothetical protein